MGLSEKAVSVRLCAAAGCWQRGSAPRDRPDGRHLHALLLRGDCLCGGSRFARRVNGSRRAALGGGLSGCRGRRFIAGGISRTKRPEAHAAVETHDGRPRAVPCAARDRGRLRDHPVAARGRATKCRCRQERSRARRLPGSSRSSGNLGGRLGRAPGRPVPNDEIRAAQIRLVIEGAERHHQQRPRSAFRRPAGNNQARSHPKPGVR